MSGNYFYIIGIVVVLLLAVWIFTIEWRLKKFFRGKQARDLEDVLVNLGQGLKKLDVSRQEIERYLETVERRLRKSIQNVNTIRFNPFGDAGSNQSFAIAFLNEEGDGVVISSLYSRERVRVYAKPIKNYQSEYTLSEEEHEAIRIAKHEV
jgi:ABC-type transporter Mla subunit MlaD